MSDWTKSKKEVDKKALDKMSEDASRYFGGIFGDISTKSASTQIALGAVSGWVTGYTTTKIGKLGAFVVGGTIIALEVAHSQGYIKIDWSKADNAADRVQTIITGEAPSWMDKAERFVDKKIDRAENILKREKKRAQKWYHNLIGDEHGPKLNDFHIFLLAFASGVTVGVAMS